MKIASGQSCSIDLLLGLYNTHRLVILLSCYLVILLSCYLVILLSWQEIILVLATK